jgi:hypothetical protein
MKFFDAKKLAAVDFSQVVSAYLEVESVGPNYPVIGIARCDINNLDANEINDLATVLATTYKDFEVVRPYKVSLPRTVQMWLRLYGTRKNSDDNSLYSYTVYEDKASL